MKQKMFKILEILGESLFYLIISYTLSSMYTSFKFQWYAIAFQAANIFAFVKYYESMRRLTASKVWTILLLILNFLAYALIAWNFGYIKGEFAPFTRLF